MYPLFPQIISLSIISLEFQPCCVSIVHSYLLLSSTTLYRHTAVCLSPQLLMDIWIVSSFRLLQIKFLWTFLCRSFCKQVLSFLLGKYLEWLDDMVRQMFGFLTNCSFPKWLNFYIATGLLLVTSSICNPLWCLLLFFNYRQSHGCELVISLWFYFSFF